MLKKYVEIVHKLIEIPRNELRAKKYIERDSSVEKTLDNYEKEYYQSCLKVEEYIDQEIKDRDLSRDL